MSAYPKVTAGLKCPEYCPNINKEEVNDIPMANGQMERYVSDWMRIEMALRKINVPKNSLKISK